MTPDLHPEELFDKAAAGALTAAEQATLGAHLAQCPVCRFERQVAQDFAALPTPGLNVDQLVTHALTARATSTLRSRNPRRVSMLAAAAVALTAMGSFAAVAQWSGLLPRLVAAVSQPEVAPPPPARTGSRPLAAPEAPPLPLAPPPVELSPEPAATPEPPLADVAPTARSAPTPLATRPPPPEPEREALPATAAELFAAANGARLDGARADAISTYQHLLTAWPDSVEAVQTRATLGRLLLDEGNPQGALEQLDAYLAGPDATLREEVLSARAQASRRLGRDAEEARAWRSLLEAYPDSIHAPRARARLGALDREP